MKKSGLNFVVSIVTCLVISYVPLVNNAISNDEVVFAVGEYDPFVSENRKDLGITTEFVRKACQQAGVEARFEFMSWNRALISAGKGAYAGTFPWRKTKSRQEHFIYPPKPVSQTHAAAFYLEGDSKKPPAFSSISQLKDFRLIGVRSYWYQKEMEAMGSRAFLTRDADQGWNLLMLKRGDLFITTFRNGLEDAKRLLGSSFNRVRYKISSSPPTNEYLIVPKVLNQEQQALMDRVVKAIQALHANGTFDTHYSIGGKY